MYRKYYSYNDMPVPVKKDTPSGAESAKDPCTDNKQAVCTVDRDKKSKGFLAGIETDDIILIMVILALLMDDCEDTLLLAAIVFVLLSGNGGL